MTRTLARLAATLVGVCLLGGCLGIRPDTAVQTGLGVEEPVPDPVFYVPAGPGPGDSPTAIITGFLHADEVTAERLGVAQTFLTKSLVATWDPGVATAVIEPAGLDIADQGNGWYAVSAPLVSAIDAQGRAQSAPPKSIAKVSLHLVQVDGQWRIDQTSDAFGRWVRTSSLDQVLRPFSLYYPAASGKSLVPDVRWLPVTRLSTGLTRALLGPPPTYLDDAVRTGLLSARLSVDAVSVNGGIATVPLTSSPAYRDAQTRSDIWAQLVQTLTQAPSISAVVVTVDGATLDATQAVPPVLSAAELGFRDLGVASGVQPVVRFGKEVVPTDLDTLLRSDADPVRQSPFPDIPTTWTGLALSFTGQELAAVGRDGTGLARYRTGKSVEAEGFADALTAPSYDRFGFLWVGGRPYDRGSSARLWTVDSNAQPFDGTAAPARPIVVSWLVDRLPLAVAVSVDGSRIAVVSTDADGKDTRLDIAGVGRDGSGAPTALSATPLRLGAALDRIRDVVWTSPTELAVLAGRDGKLLPSLVTLGDEITALAPLEGAQSITTLGGSRNLAIGSATGHVFVRAGDHWQALPPSASELVAPGR